MPSGAGSGGGACAAGAARRRSWAAPSRPGGRCAPPSLAQHRDEHRDERPRAEQDGAGDDHPAAHRPSADDRGVVARGAQPFDDLARRDPGRASRARAGRPSRGRAGRRPPQVLHVRRFAPASATSVSIRARAPGRSGAGEEHEPAGRPRSRGARRRWPAGWRHVAAGQHDARRPAAAASVWTAQQGGDADRAGALHDEPRTLDEQDHRLGDLVLAATTTSSTHSRTSGSVTSPGRLTAMPSAIVTAPSTVTGVPARSEEDTSGGLDLDADDLDLRSRRLDRDGQPEARPPPPTGLRPSPDRARPRAARGRASPARRRSPGRRKVHEGPRRPPRRARARPPAPHRWCARVGDRRAQRRAAFDLGQRRVGHEDLAGHPAGHSRRRSGPSRGCPPSWRSTPRAAVGPQRASLASAPRS